MIYLLKTKFSIFLCIKGCRIFKWCWNFTFSLSALGVMPCCSSRLFSCPSFFTHTTHRIYFHFPLKKLLISSAFHFSKQENTALGVLQTALEKVLWRIYEKTFSFDTCGTKNYLMQLQGTRVFDAVLSTMKSGLLKWGLNVCCRLFQQSWRQASYS